jgi:hypothetical protein
MNVRKNSCKPHLKNRPQLQKRMRQLILSLLTLNIKMMISETRSVNRVVTKLLFLIDSFGIVTRVSHFHLTVFKYDFFRISGSLTETLPFIALDILCFILVFKESIKLQDRLASFPMFKG